MKVEKKEKRKTFINSNNKQDVRKKYTLFKNCIVKELNSPGQWKFETYRKKLSFMPLSSIFKSYSKSFKMIQNLKYLFEIAD